MRYILIAIVTSFVCAYITNVVFTGSVSQGNTESEILYNAPSATMVNTVKFEDSLPTLSITPGTYCTLGVALVKSLGFTPFNSFMANPSSFLK